MLEKDTFLSEKEKKLYEDNLRWAVDFTYNILKQDFENVPYEEIDHVFRTDRFKSYTGSITLGCKIGIACGDYEYLCYVSSNNVPFDRDFIRATVNHLDKDNKDVGANLAEEMFKVKAPDEKSLPYYRCAYLLVNLRIGLRCALFLSNALLMMSGLPPISIQTEQIADLMWLRKNAKDLKEVANLLMNKKERGIYDV